MNTTSENIAMIIVSDELALPPLIRVVSAEIDFSAFPYNREEPQKPQLETQVSGEIDWASWPYCLSFPEVSGVCKL